MLLGSNVIDRCVIDLDKLTIKFPIYKPCGVNIDASYLKIKILSKLTYGRAKTHQLHVNHTIAETEADEKSAPATMGHNSRAPCTQRVHATAQLTSAPCSPITENNIKCPSWDEPFSVNLTEPLTVPGNTVMRARVRINKSMRNGQDVVIHHTQIKPLVAIANVVTTVKQQKRIINIANLGDEPVTLKPGTKLGTAEYLNASDAAASVKVVNQTQLSLGDDPTEPPVVPITDEDVTCDDSLLKERLLSLLNEHRDALWLEGESLGCYTAEQLEIKLKSDVIVNQRPYRIPHTYQQKLNDIIKRMLKDGTISRSKSSYNSPLIIVKKSDADIRPCVDYRQLNDITESVNFPLPRISDLLNSIGQATFVSTLDLASAYHQCSIAERDRGYTAFTVNNTKYHWNKIPFGLQSAPGFFARIINEVLYDVLGPQCLAYMDDIILFSKSTEQHFETIAEVLSKLSAAGLKLKIRKCRFFAKEIKFLGYRMTEGGMTMDPSRVEAINNMAMPTNKKSLQAFLGVCNYFRVFVKNFAHIAEPLYNLLRKDVTFVWSAAQTQAVVTLKAKLAQAPVVMFPRYEEPFLLHTDASNVGIGAVLMQRLNGRLHPVAYVSKTLNKAQRSYAVTKKEALALVYALEQFRHIILAYPVHVYTDHKPLLGVLSKSTKDECLQRWSLLIQEYKVEIHYLEGKDNIFADPLSRLPAPEELPDSNAKFQADLNERNYLCASLTERMPVKSPWSDTDLREAQRKDPHCVKICQQLRRPNAVKVVPPALITKARLFSGILYVLRTIKRANLLEQYLVPYVPDKLMPEAFNIVHRVTTAGHHGPERTLQFFTRSFYHVKERQLITSLCNECELCIQAKGLPRKVPMLKYPIPIRPFHTITSDILGPQQITESGNRFVLTIRDFTTRYTVLFPLKTKSTLSIIDALRQVISNYGSSQVMITDNAAEYTSEKMAAFLRFYNTRKTEIAPYHAASQGLAERVNREVTKLLRIYLHQYAAHNWDELLPVLQLTINSTYNSSIQEAPFFALFGYDSSTTVLSPPRLNYDESDLAQHMQRVSQIRHHCRENLLQAQANYTEYANVGRKPKLLKIGQRVYAKLDKHRATSAKKLDLPISGPLTIVEPRGNAWVLNELNTGKKFVVHPDYIIPSGKQPLETTQSIPKTDKFDSLETTKVEIPIPPTEPSLEVPIPPTEPTIVPEAPLVVVSPSKPPVGPTRRQPPRSCKNSTTPYTL